VIYMNSQKDQVQLTTVQYDMMWFSALTFTFINFSVSLPIKAKTHKLKNNWKKEIVQSKWVWGMSNLNNCKQGLWIVQNNNDVMQQFVTISRVT